jgi:DNA repair exonuclease SbcCD ATPase subunit
MDLKIEQNSYDSVSLLIKNNQKEQENCTLTLEVLMSKNLVSELKNKEEAYKQQEIEIENIKEKVTLKNEISLRLATNNAKKSQLSDEIIDLTKRLDSLKVKEFTISIEDLQKQLDIDSQKYQTVYAQNEKSNEDLKNYRFVGEILSEDGIKSYFLKKLLPILNQTVNEYLNKLDLPVQLQFNEKMDETIKGLAGYQNEINYYSLSSGERTKVDISILLSFISVTKAIVNWNCNLILFDEILDANLDSEALNKVLNSLRTLVDNSKELCSYVISHKAQDSLEYFNRIINITKENGFSKLSATLN